MNHTVQANQPASARRDLATILCVLSEHQQQQFAAEFDRMAKPGIGFVFQTSPQAALEQVGTLAPDLVIVGMTIGVMEGLEFLALMTRRYPGFKERVIVLPDKEDPFPPMLHHRDPVTKRATTEETDIPGIASVVRSLVPTRASASLEAPLVSLEATPHPDALAPPVEHIPLVEAAPPAAGAPKWRAPAMAAGVAAVVAVGLVAAMAGGDADPEGATTMPPTPVPAAAAQEPQPQPAPPPAPKARALDDAPDSVPAPTAAGAGKDAVDTGAARDPEPDSATPPTGELTTLPLQFLRGRAGYTVADAAALSSIVSGLQKTLADNANARVEIGGHTSSEASDSYNLALGTRRASNVRDHLVEQGLPEDRIEIKSYGSGTPAVVEAGPTTREKNRRVTLRVIE